MNRAMMLMVTVLFASVAVAQTKKKAEESQIKTYEMPKAPAPGEGAKKGKKVTPMGVKSIVARPEAMADEKLEEAVQTLQQLIDSTDDDDPTKPEYLTRLAELYWDRAENYFNKAYGDEMFRKLKAAQDSGDDAAVIRVQEEQAELLKQRAKWQNEAVKVYMDVVNRFPDARNIDAVLYYLGFTLVQLDRAEEAYPYFTRIVRDIPTSPYAPDALLNVGEFYFNSGRMQEAYQIYSEVENFPTSNAYGLAIYKKGWCLFNMGKHDEAMDQFLKVIEFAKSEQAKAIGYGQQLLREAQRDLVMVYSQAGTPEQAISVFKQISPSNYMELALRLAEGYASQGAYDNSSKLLKKIIAEYKDTPEAYRVIEHQRLILQNAYRLGVKTKVAEEARRLVGLLDRFKDSAPKDFYASEMEQVEELLRVISTSYHKEVAVTKEEATMELTQAMYGDYLRLFPDSPERYNITLNYALLLAQLGRHAEAADRFSEVVAMKPDSEAALRAAHEAVSCYYKMMEAQKQQRKSKSEDTSDLEPKPLPEFEQKLVAASERYIKMAPEGAPDLTEARFVAALAYYQYNHFKEASERFREIIQRDPDHPNAPDAARLLLSSLHLMRDIKGLNAAADDISRNPKLMQGEVPTIVTRIKEQADFNKCYEFEQAGRHTTAAECFLDYVKRFPSTPLKDRALMNAGNNFFRARLVEKSLTANTQLVNEMPDSPLRPQALFNIADTYRRLAVYSEAARFYEIFVDLYPNHDLTEEALRNATIFRTGLGDYSLAIKDLSRYLQLYPKSPHAPSVYQEIGNILLKQKNAAAAQKHFEQYLAKYGKGGGLDLWIRAHLRIAHAWRDQGKADVALTWYKKTVQAYNNLSDEEKTKVTAVGLAAAAEARFMEGEAMLEEVRKIKLQLPEKAIAEGIQKKLVTTKAAMDILSSVEAFQQPHWTIAAYSRKGFAYQELAMSIENAPVPPNLPPDAVEYYKSGLMEKAQGTWERAKEEFKRCVETAQNLKWYNEYSTEAEDALMKLDPEFRSLPDIRPEPVFYTPNQGKPSLIPVTQDEDVPKWTDPELRNKVNASVQSNPTAEALYDMGAILEAEGDLGGARSWYEKALAKKPDLAFAMARLGMLDIAEGRVSEGEAKLENALKIDPANPTAHNRTAARMLAERNFAEAVNHARMALVADPDNLDAYLNLAATYYQMNLVDVGILVGRNALSIDPKDAPIQNMLGLFFLKKGEVRQAVAMFEKATNDNPRLFDAHMNLGLITLSYKDYASAANHLKAASDLAPRHTGARLALAAALRGQGRGEEARKLLDEIVKNEPSNPDPHYNLCLLFQETLANSDEQALAECEQFVRMAPPSHPKRKEAERRIGGIKATIEANREASKTKAQ